MPFRSATPADVPVLLRMQERFYADGGYPFSISVAERATRELIADSRFGRLFVIETPDAVGYLVITFGFSLEFGGRDAFVDELYVSEPWRGRGLGVEALAVAEAACRDAGIHALHLEVEHENERARALYERSGYMAHTRHLMTKRL